MRNTAPHSRIPINQVCLVVLPAYNEVKLSDTSPVQRRQERFDLPCSVLAFRFLPIGRSADPNRMLPCSGRTGHGSPGTLCIEHVAVAWFFQQSHVPVVQRSRDEAGIKRRQILTLSGTTGAALRPPHVGQGWRRYPGTEIRRRSEGLSHNDQVRTKASVLLLRPLSFVISTFYFPLSSN